MSGEKTLGSGAAEHVWRLSGRAVAGVGQLLLWVLAGIGRLLRPLGDKALARLYGSRQQQPQPPYGHPQYPRQGPYGPHGTMLAPVPEETGPVPRSLAWWGRFRASWVYAPVTGLLLALAALYEVGDADHDLFSVPAGFALAATVPMVWRKEVLRPVAAIVLSATAAALLSGQALLITTLLSALWVLYLLAQQLPRASAGLLACCALAVIGVVYLAGEGLDNVPWPAVVVAVVGAIGLGDARRTVADTEAEAREQNTETLVRLDAAQREQAIMRERARIARELHDVVAHSVSMIAVQAETAPYTMSELSDEAKRGYSEIAHTAREALVEMRRLLGVLRSDAAAETEVTPQPRLDRLNELIDQHRSAGGAAGLAVRGEEHPLSATLELSAYRIVQEALTNVRRHAPGAPVQIELVYQPDRLRVRVHNQPPDLTRTRVDGFPAPATGGHGLIGMQERAAMLGGRLQAGPSADGGFDVEAELPFSP
ncbi:sensor histidine kinase [Actinocorallia libanotica]|uniref:histidine kinase n=1 Tax=Actinocorallia libanotica TaxID=46162 RepID=A0ABN1RHD2_9ACTN